MQVTRADNNRRYTDNRVKGHNNNPQPLPNTINLEHARDNASRPAKAFQSA